MNQDADGPSAPKPATPERRRDVMVLMGILGVLVVLGVCFMIFLYPQLAKKVPDAIPDISLPQSAPEPDDELTTAAKRGEAWAQHRLAVQLSTGTDRKKNAPLAAEWFRKAAHQNHADAQYELGLLFETGEGVTANLTEAYYWVLLSDLNSNKLAKAKLKSLAARLTPSERAHAEGKVEQDIALRQPLDSNATAPHPNED